MPTAYHIGFADGRPDPGADPICDGGDVLEWQGSTLINKYAEGGSVGDLHRPHAHLCKLDYLAIKEAGFPACGPGHLCMRWYGVAVQPRSCGYNRAHELGCGVPIVQRDEHGLPTQYYLTTNTLRRPGSSASTTLQSDYADASLVPFIVVPGDGRLPGGLTASPGDYAIIVANGAAVYAVVGDSGPSNRLGEASRALLARLGGSTIDSADGAFTMVFPGTADLGSMKWPLDPVVIQRNGENKIKNVVAMPAGNPVAVAKSCASALSRSLRRVGIKY